MAPQSPDDKIPVYELSDIGRALADQLTAMGYSCDFVVRAPGRVNLIAIFLLPTLNYRFKRLDNQYFCFLRYRHALLGEHIDYNGYAVLPMALTQAIHLAVGSNKEATLILSSTESDFE
ncbi:hypothetical protein FBUS_04786 [Fasciolopsis buskii]|uniref:Galactokinase N-terminal domain-containing protein n=1 Tax=Fasciolopsis buskii TaxID=27845 RepID=A0A8E0RJN8_9TREM|nr:hypothetical protein FBUS_04786 [Fasciolopsis buski]